MLKVGATVRTRFDIRELVEIRKNENQELYVYWESRKGKKTDCGGCHPDVFRAWQAADADGEPADG